MHLIGLVMVVMALQALPVAAENGTVKDRETFLRLVSGKVLARPLIRLTVTGDGVISGRGAAKPVSGAWAWKDGYFCRHLYWGDRALGHNCQRVEAREGRIRFTSDRGRGQSAEFHLR